MKERFKNFLKNKMHKWPMTSTVIMVVGLWAIINYFATLLLNSI